MLKREKHLNCYMHLMGGLGNQLFQLAAGLHHSVNHGCILVLDESSESIRRNDLGHADVLSYQSSEYLNTRVQSWYKIIVRKFTNKIIWLSLSSNLNKLKSCFMFLLIYIQSVIVSTHFRKIVKVWSARQIGYEPIKFRSYSNYLIGYFQTYKYASEPHVNSILRALTDPHKSIDSYKDLCRKEKPLIVHIRLGDYVNEPNFGIISKDYYFNSISTMMQQYNFMSIHVFSDEIETAKSFIPKNYLSICRWMDGKGESSITTLEKMRCGSAYIIGNSTFSWWGSFLSHSINPPTIAPEPWFAGMNDPNELIPPEWIRMRR